MCGIVAYWDKTGRNEAATGRIVMTMLDALGCRGPDGAGVALIGPEPAGTAGEEWSVRIAGCREMALDGLTRLGRLVPNDADNLLRPTDLSAPFHFRPLPGVTPDEFEHALGARRGGLEILSLGRRLDLVKCVGTPRALDDAFAVSAWSGPLAIGHTRMSTESRIDLSHSQPFWAHGLADVATVHNGHVTNYHQLRRYFEQCGTTFFTDNDSEVIGVYLRDRLARGRRLDQALADSVGDLDGAFNYLVASPEGLGIVRDRFGFKPLVLAETDEFVAVATEEIALRRAIPGAYSATEPPPGSAIFYALGRERQRAAQ